MLDLLLVSLLTGLLYSLITLGAGTAFRVLNFPDLTLEGGGVFAAVISFKVLEKSGTGLTALMSAFIGGCGAGAVTGLLHTRLRVSRLLSGIITSAILYSVNLRLLGGLATRRLPDGVHTLFDLLGERRTDKALIIAAAVCLVGLALFSFFFSTKLGYLLKALGDEPRLVVQLGYSEGNMLVVGLIAANGLIGAGMGLLLQYRRVVDVNMVGGLLVSTLAALVLGEVSLRPRSLPTFCLAAFGGTILYSIVLAIALHSWTDNWEQLFHASDVRLITGLLLLVAASLLAKSISGFRLFVSNW